MLFEDTAELDAVQMGENDDIVDAVQELGAKILTNLFHHAFFHPDWVTLFEDKTAPDVRGHDDDRVRKINGPSLAICSPAVVQDLKEYVKNIRVCLLDFIQENHRIGAPAHGFGERPSFFITDVPGGGSDQPRDRVSFHVFAHVNADHGLLVVEQKFRECFGCLGFAYARRTQEQERPHGTMAFFQTDSGASDRVCDHLERALLADDAPAESLFHFDQLFLFAFEHS